MQALIKDAELHRASWEAAWFPQRNGIAVETGCVFSFTRPHLSAGQRETGLACSVSIGSAVGSGIISAGPQAAEEDKVRRRCRQAALHYTVCM